MPRAFLPHARSLAAADSPLLPFLAPRVFAGSPIYERENARVHGNRRSQEEREANTKARLESFPYSKYSRLDRSALVPTGSFDLRTKHHDCLSQASHPFLSRPRTRPYELSSSVSGRRYADIYAITRNQSACFSTSTSRQARQRPKGWVHRVPISKDGALNREEQDATLEFVRAWVRGTSLQSTPLLNLRRRRILNTTLKAYDALLARYSHLDDEERFKVGRYRSLLRRIYTLSRTKGVTRLDSDRERGNFDRIGLTRLFAALDQNVFHRMKRARHKIKIIHDHSAAQSARQLFEHGGHGENDQENVYLKWHKYSSEYQDSNWHLILFYLLDKSPRNALRFVQVLAQEPVVATMKEEILADALEHIARSLVTPIRGAKVEGGRRFVPVFAAIFLAHFTESRTICSQDLMYNVARLATPPQLRRVYDLFTGHNTFLGYDTRLHYANRFGEEGDHEYALRCLRDTVRHVSDATTRVDLVARRRFSWSSALILRKSVKNGQNYHMTTDIVAEFLNIGLKLDLLLYNVIIHNAIEAGDYETAFRVFNLLKDHHITPDKHTFSILLHGCTILDNPTRFHDFALHCAEKAHELRDPWLATDYLYYQYITEDKHHLEQRIACIRAYTKLFSIDPLLPFCPELKAFSMHKNGGDTQEESDVPKMEPPPAALYTMLQFEIRKAAAVGPRKVWDLLFLFRSLVLEGRHAGLTKLAKEPLIWNAFLLSFCRKQQFANASQLMKNMTDGLLGFPQPNVYSWNIFMQAFWKSGQHKGAERIYEIMRSRGVEPDQFTYGVLLKGYARAQNAERVAEYLHLVDHEEQLDPAILQVLTRMHDQKRLMMELEKDRVMREREQRKRVEEPWGLPQFQSLLSSTQFANLNKPEESLGGRPGSSPLPADRTFTSLLRRPLSLPVSAPRSVTESGVASTNPESADIHTPPMPVRKVKAKRTVPMKRATRSVPTRRRIKP